MLDVVRIVSLGFGAAVVVLSGVMVWRLRGPEWKAERLLLMAVVMWSVAGVVANWEGVTQDLPAGWRIPVLLAANVWGLVAMVALFRRNIQRVKDTRSNAGS